MNRGKCERSVDLFPHGLIDVKSSHRGASLSTRINTFLSGVVKNSVPSPSYHRSQARFPPPSSGYATSLLISLFDPTVKRPLALDLGDSVLQVVLLEVLHVHRGDEVRGVGEEVVHLFQGSLGRLWLEGPEEEGVGEVADDLGQVRELGSKLG